MTCRIFSLDIQCFSDSATSTTKSTTRSFKLRRFFHQKMRCSNLSFSLSNSLSLPPSISLSLSLTFYPLCSWTDEISFNVTLCVRHLGLDFPISFLCGARYGQFFFDTGSLNFFTTTAGKTPPELSSFSHLENLQLRRHLKTLKQGKPW